MKTLKCFLRGFAVTEGRRDSHPCWNSSPSELAITPAGIELAHRVRKRQFSFAGGIRHIHAVRQARKFSEGGDLYLLVAPTGPPLTVQLPLQWETEDARTGHPDVLLEKTLQGRLQQRIRSTWERGDVPGGLASSRIEKSGVRPRHGKSVDSLICTRTGISAPRRCDQENRPVPSPGAFRRRTRHVNGGEEKAQYHGLVLPPPLHVETQGDAGPFYRAENYSFPQEREYG